MITDGEIADACNKAYIKAGHNAYFGNGFEAGVRFALEQVKNCSIPAVSNSICHTCLNTLENGESDSICKKCWVNSKLAKCLLTFDSLAQTVKLC